MISIRSIISCGVGAALLFASCCLADDAATAQMMEVPGIYAMDNLVAWCIVPFDGKRRGPEERADMLARLGFKHFAYDWRSEHVPTLDAEIAALRKHGIALDAFWFPAALNADAKAILSALERNHVKTQLWITMGDSAPKGDQSAKVAATVSQLTPIADAASKIGCKIALYNHGGWFGEPENEIAIVKAMNRPDVGIIYNLHHGHDHLDRLPEVLDMLKPHLWAINLNGMIAAGDRNGKKIVPLGQGNRDLEVLRIIAGCGYKGPIGILGHTNDDAELRLKDNLEGLEWLKPQLNGAKASERPKPRTPF